MVRRIKSFKFQKSHLDFIFLSGANFIVKIIGFIREIIIAALLGTSLELAIYITLKTGIDFLTVISSYSAFQGNLVPKLSRIHDKNKNVSFYVIFRLALKIGLILSAISLFILFLIGELNSFWQYNIILLIFVIAFTTGAIVLNDFGLIIHQAKGNFRKFSLSTFYNYSVALIFLFPLIKIFGVLGLAFSRILGIFSVIKFSWSGLNLKKTESKEQNQAILVPKDFDPNIFLVANHAMVIILVGRWFIGIDDISLIANYYYAAILLNAFMTIVVRSISAIILQKSALKNVFEKINKVLIFIFMFSLIIIGFNFLLGEWFIKLIYERNAFSSDDSQLTAEVLKLITIPFVFLYLSSILIQPLMGSITMEAKKFNYIISVTIISILILFAGISVFFSVTDSKLFVAIYLYAISGLVFLISLISYLKLRRLQHSQN